MEKNLNTGNALLDVIGVMWPRVWAGSLVSYISISLGSWLSRVACVKDVREYPCSQGPVLDLISFKHTILSALTTPCGSALQKSSTKHGTWLS